MTTGRGIHNGKISNTVHLLETKCPTVVTPLALVELCGLTRKQAENAIQVAKSRGLIRSVSRGIFEPVPRLAAG